ncbi:MAG: hypothetical protein ACI8RL_000647 [Cyclobacteriaceae bacterium]|jgi:hypothetical protein
MQSSLGQRSVADLKPSKHRDNSEIYYTQLHLVVKLCVVLIKSPQATFSYVLLFFFLSDLLG